VAGSTRRPVSFIAFRSSSTSPASRSASKTSAGSGWGRATTGEEEEGEEEEEEDAVACDCAEGREWKVRFGGEGGLTERCRRGIGGWVRPRVRRARARARALDLPALVLHRL
jgi:hypothetical protein